MFEAGLLIIGLAVFCAIAFPISDFLEDLTGIFGLVWVFIMAGAVMIILSKLL